MHGGLIGDFPRRRMDVGQTTLNLSIALGRKIGSVEVSDVDIGQSRRRLEIMQGVPHKVANSAGTYAPRG